MKTILNHFRRAPDIIIGDTCMQRWQIIQMFHYEPETGQLFWKKRPKEHFKTEAAQKAFNTLRSGKEFGYEYLKGNTRYRQGEINGRPVQTHRIVFLIVHGWLPKEVDHIDHDGLNNRANNLRAATHQENSKNRPPNKNNRSGVVGVSWMNSTCKWRAYITVDNQQISLGCHANKVDAISARRQAERDYGFHINHGATRCGDKAGDTGRNSQTNLAIG